LLFGNILKVFDFFSGCGGTSLGFRNYGFEIVGALDFDKDSADTFRSNFPGATVIEDDIRSVSLKTVETVLENCTGPVLFSGCAPCQPFSTQRKLTTKNDPRKNLLTEFQKFIDYFQPEYIFLENVPGIQNISKSDEVFKRFITALSKWEYSYDFEVVDTTCFGVPQTRKRLVLIAAKAGCNISKISEVKSSASEFPASVRESISDLPKIKAGEKHARIPNHVAAKLSPLNLLRIQNTPEGGDRRDWPESLMAGCHKNYTGHTDVYGRMYWDRPASTLTTRCISYSNGRFGHPEQNRALSVREAARLQTFPDSFVFSGSLISTAKQVGNAVPPRMAEALASCFG